MKRRVGFFCPGQWGDLGSATSVLKYKDILWPNTDIIWFCSMPRAELLKYNDAIAEVRPWAEGWQLPERCELENAKLKPGEQKWEDWSVLKTANNRLNQKLKHNFESIKDLDEGYFPAPWQMSLEQRHGIDYPNCSRKIFGVNPSWAWHPYLCFSNEEREMVKDFCLNLPHKKTILMETFLGSGQASWNDGLTRATMTMCRNKFGPCNFIFASHMDNSRFFDDVGVVSCSHFNVRQTALVNNYSDLMVCISSGISVVTSCWGNKPVQKIQYTGSFIGSTQSHALGPFTLIESDHNSNAEQQFKHKLVDLLDKME